MTTPSLRRVEARPGFDPPPADSGFLKTGPSPALLQTIVLR